MNILRAIQYVIAYSHRSWKLTLAWGQNAPCTNKSIAAILEAFVGMKEDVRAVLDSKAAPTEMVEKPRKEYRRRGKAPKRDTFDVEHQDKEDLDFQVCSPLCGRE